MTDVINPKHYKAHPVFPGECIDYTRHMTFTQGNAFKYLWRLGEKGDMADDLGKARWYVEESISQDGMAAVNINGKVAHLTNLISDERIGWWWNIDYAMALIIGAHMSDAMKKIDTAMMQKDG